MNIADDQVVLAALKAAYPAAKRLRNPLTPVSDEKPATVWGKLRKALEAHEVFGKGRHVFAGAHQLQLHPSILSQYINRPLAARGPGDTLRWLHAIFSVEKFVSRQCAELIGVKVVRDYAFANGVQLLPLGNMRPSWHSNQLRYVYEGPRSFLAATPSDVAGMIQKVELTFSTDHNSHRQDYSAFSDLALAITAAANAAPVVGTAWGEYEDTDFADAEFGWMHTPARHEGRPPQFSTVTLEDDHVERINRFLSLSGKVKRACVTAAACLNSARRRVEAGQSAIDLATAFESLLATGDERTEITYRLRLRAALILASDYEGRLEVSNRIRDLYGLRSKIVHGDSVASSTTADRSTVEWGTQNFSRLLNLVISEGRLPDLKRLELTGDTGEAFPS
ncbi:HEPN domain-containing protein [Rhizobium ruizarguesonis]|uniref:HEPN domain-containing protein n=1 Tax=Rhizobium ruizarguesonis TaxID=2081791 RepID=UPI00103062EE|nr:HEPN domain-containing protein [Rhizobium ruizarguesonis]TAU29155.1 hypothetical protein ELI48_24990 [Rhizobium ruizarguesonis]TAU71155.1 hypothetical protein ELI45_26625 [Rhizobium ruizarguesonis]TAV18290.1 hypothetical protein ELI34_24315 [Rhizobium ruizarguesonis]TAV30530.1 hypothetical protein ELI35_24325 [Rhizobium ruizarguesonis]TAW12467.1 hypothetical protein ELI26_24465 [Rhizobium ruizarguesonis]